MRLIDADALIMALRLEYPMMPMFKENQKEWTIKTDGYRMAEEVIRNAPTIGAVSVVHGEWIYDANGYDYGLPAWKCNRCGCINANIPPRIMTKESKPNYAPVNPYAFSGSNYCPNCGARMKGADDE